MSYIGMEIRPAHELMMALSVIVLFALVLDNIWLSLFLGWTVFLYCFFGCSGGENYVTNLFYGCILYFLVKVAFDKEHIDFFLDGVLWLAFINILYMCVQLLGYNFIFASAAPYGFMANRGITGIFFALCIPLLARRNLSLSALLFIPLWIGGTATSMAAGIIGWLFFLFFRIPKKTWIILCLVLFLMGSYYLIFINHPGTERFMMWRMALQDTILHPMTGWGLNSFANYTQTKDMVYLLSSLEANGEISKWDNPHNLYVSLFFEWGIVGLFLLGGYLRQCGLAFNRAIKEPNTLALASLLIVFFVSSIFWFPIFLARMAVIIVPCFALYELQTK